MKKLNGFQRYLKQLLIVKRQYLLIGLFLQEIYQILVKSKTVILDYELEIQINIVITEIILMIFPHAISVTAIVSNNTRDSSKKVFYVFDYVGV